MFFGVYRGYAYSYQRSETSLPHNLRLWCWKCLRYDTPANHNWLTCVARRNLILRIQSIRKEFELPPISPSQRSNHYVEFATAYVAILNNLGVVTNRREVSDCPFPVQDSTVTSTKTPDDGLPRSDSPTSVGSDSD